LDVFDLFAKLSIDTSEYEKGLNDAEEKAKSSGIGKALGIAAKAGVAAVGAASTAIGAITVKSVDAYAEYEQLVGGVQKLYGNMGQTLEEYAEAQGQTIDEAKGKWQELEDAQNLVAENAKSAYRTAGMSMNEYMDTATSFSAALINSLGGDTLKAAEQTDIAMRAISDNFNTFGGDIEGVKNAFMGFAKQNYTMLDNLKLGYGGTKEGMEQLIADANEYAESIGQAGDLTIDSFSDIVTAIDLVQQKQNIAGTTAREASTTIQGSLGMVGAAWQNLLTAMSDKDADFAASIDGLVDSLVGFEDEAGNHVNGLADNIIPVAEQALVGIGEMIEKLAPMIGEKIPALIDELAPSLVSAGTSLVSSIVSGIVNNIDGVLDMLLNLIGIVVDGLGAELPSLLGTLLDKIPDIVSTVADAITENLPLIIDAGLSMLEGLAEKLSDPSGLTKIITAGTNLVVTLGNGLVKAIPRLVKMIPTVVQGLVSALTENLPIVLNGIIELVNGIVTELPNIITAIGEALPELIQIITQALIDNLPVLIDGLVTLITVLADNLPDIIIAIIEVLPQILEAIVSALIELTPVLIEGIITVVATLAQKLPEIAMELVKAIPQILVNIVGAFGGIVGDLIGVFTQAWDGIKGVFTGAGDWFKSTFTTAKDNATGAWNNAKSAFKNAWDGIKKAYDDGGINGVVGWFGDKFQKAKDAAIKAWDNIKNDFTEVVNKIKGVFEDLIEGALAWGKDLLGNFIKGITDKLPDLKGAVSGAADAVSDFLHFSEPDKGSLADFHTFAPDMMKLFAEGVTDNTKLVTDAVSDAFDFKDAINPPVMDTAYVGAEKTMDSIYLQKMVLLMEQILAKDTDIVLEGDAADIFRVVERENRISTRATGFNQLSMVGVN
jgi:phage-related protein